LQNNINLIIYHGHCPDGWCAAHIASNKYPNAVLMSRDHGLEPPYEEVKGKDVLVVDFSWRTREQNDKLASLSNSFRILDHHKTSQATLEKARYVIFDMNRSGAGLTWDYLFGKDSTRVWDRDREERKGGVDIGIPRPWWVNYTEDRDLWNWKLPRSKEICAYLGTLPFTREAWNYLNNITELQAAELGTGALAHINHYVREAAQQARTGTWMGYKTSVLNVPYLNCSEVGNELAKTHQVSLTWFERGDDFVQFSLRSIGDIDVSEIAKKEAGGGHKNAAGFQLNLLDARRLIDEILNRTVRLRVSMLPSVLNIK